MESVDGSPCLGIASWAHRTNLSSPHFLSNEMKIKDDRGSKTNSWLYINTEPNRFPHILGRKWKLSDKRFIIKRIIIRKGASQIGCEVSLTASIRSWKMAVWDLPLVESNHIFVTITLWRQDIDTFTQNQILFFLNIDTCQLSSSCPLNKTQENVNLWF